MKEQLHLRGFTSILYTRGLCYCCLWSPESVQDMHWKRGQKDSFWKRGWIRFWRRHIPVFLAGYYLFSNENVMEKIKNAVLPLGICAAVSGIFYIVRCYGMAYTDKEVLSRWDLNLYAFFMVLLVLGAGPKWLDFSNNFTNYMRKCCFGIYVLHIPVLLVINYLLAGKELPLTVVYGIELVGGFVVSILLYEVIRRIPVLRYWILGIRKQRNNVWKARYKGLFW